MTNSTQQDSVAVLLRRVLDDNHACGHTTPDTLNAIESALQSQQVASADRGEAVAWQARAKPDGKWIPVSKANTAILDDAWEVRELYAATPPSPAESAEGAHSEHVRKLVGKLDQWRMCMSHNESYFGEPAGLVKSVCEELAHAVDPIYPPKPTEPDPLAGVTIYTHTVPFNAPAPASAAPSGVSDADVERVCDQATLGAWPADYDADEQAQMRRIIRIALEAAQPQNAPEPQP